MRLNHLWENEPGHPGIWSRSGAPFMGWIGSPFIAKVIRLFESIAFLIGTPLEIGSLPGLPERCVSEPLWAV